MKTMLKLLKRFHKDEKGVTLVEYGIALILAVAVGGTLLGGLATDVQNKMSAASSCLNAGASVNGQTCP